MLVQLSGQDRRRIRLRLKVIHRHRAGGVVSPRTSTLFFARGRPTAVVEWIDLGSVRTPLYACELDPRRLRHFQDETFQYDGLTHDPRFY
jgi:hypothetical protein